jgi:hypothetical protein
MRKFKPSVKTRFLNKVRVQPKVLLFTLWRSGTHWVGDMLQDMMGIRGVIESTDDTRYKEETVERIKALQRNTFLVRHISHTPDELMPLLAELGFRVVVLVRDPRDVIVSNIHMRKYHEGYRKGLPPFPDMSIEEILNWELDTYTETYIKRIPSWVNLQHPRVIAVRYEDLQADTLKELCRIRDFLGVRVSKRRLTQIVENNRFEKVNQRPKGQENKHSHNRKGIVGDYKNFFSIVQQERLNEVLQSSLLHLGYEVD